MGRVKLEISRRDLLKTGVAAGVAGAVGTVASAAPAQAAPRPDAWYRQGEVRTAYTVCDICPWQCGLVVRSVDGVVRKIDGNPKDPKSRGFLCPRGQGGVSFLNDPDRLRAPMVRTGERGEGKFQEVDWDFALDLLAQKLEEIRERSGPEAVAIFGHTSGDHWWADHFAQAWGTPNAAKPASSLCVSPREEASIFTTGGGVGGHEPIDWEELECLALIGSHIGEDARNTTMQDFANVFGRGGRIIVVDPRYSSAATKASHWLPIKASTDTALLLAWMHVLIHEGFTDDNYIRDWTSGFNQLAAHVEPLTPEWAADITDLPADAIRDTARELGAHAPRAAILPGRHTTWYGNDTQRMRAVYLVNALLGAYGQEGGIYFNRTPYLEEFPHPPYAVAGSSGGCAAPVEDDDEPGPLPEGPTGKSRADGVREKFMQGPTAIQELIEPMITGDPYRIEGLICYGTNLLHSIPQTDRTIEALQALDLVVSIDVLPMEHIAWSDIVLPESTYLERWEDLFALAHKTPYIAVREPAVEPLYDTKPGWWMAKELANRVGLEGFFNWENFEDYLNTRLRSVGSNLQDIRAEGGILMQEGRPYLEDFEGSSPFATPSGKLELFSQRLADAGHDPMPVYEAVDEPPEGFYRLLYGRHPVHTFAKTQNTPALYEAYPENELWINADVVDELGLTDGTRVMLENQDGATSGPIKLKATQRIRRDAVFMAHGWGHNSPGLSLADGKGASDAKLQTQYALDPICGGAGLRVNFVRITSEA